MPLFDINLLLCYKELKELKGVNISSQNSFFDDKAIYWAIIFAAFSLFFSIIRFLIF